MASVPRPLSRSESEVYGLRSHDLPREENGREENTGINVAGPAVEIGQDEGRNRHGEEILDGYARAFNSPLG